MGARLSRLLARVNIANLTMARAWARDREVAVRAAIGATRARVARQFVTEGVVLALLGGAGGIAVAAVTMRFLVQFAPASVPRLDEVEFDLSVLLLTSGLTFASALVVGLTSAWRMTSGAGEDVLRGAAGRTVHGSRRARAAQSALVVGQIGMTTMCLVVAGLLLVSFANLIGVDKGFNAANVATIEVNLTGKAYAGPDGRSRAEFARRLVDRVRALPGTETVGITTQQVLSGEGFNTRLGAEHTAVPFPERPLAALRGVDGDYFRALGIALERGRSFSASEPARVAVISAAAARRLWPGVDPIGRRLRRGGDQSPLIEVVGVVPDVRASRLDDAPTYAIYVPYPQFSVSQISVAVRTRDDPRAVAPSLRSVVRGLDPGIAVSPVRTLDDVVAESVSDRQFLLVLALAFALGALTIASIGVYGVLSHAVGQRRTEFGLRVALGARPREIRRMVLRDAWRLLATGLAVGIPAALGLRSTLRTLLFDVLPHDPAVMSAACALLAATATLAAYLPARRASRVDPLVALRSE